MPKLTVEDLKKIKEEYKAKTALREGKHRVKVTVHMGTCGLAAGARKIMDVILDEISNRDLADVVVTTSGCAGLCSREPMITVQVLDSPPVKYCDLNEEKTRKIVEEHIVGGNPVEKLALVQGCETSY
ncbi:MAG: (2Fe-2S) ferredoxin domain-containing protein [Nitrospirae bacterium]|nr:MAG: (2Fe-2S) ferredoxin domain-containing protein [Nitrospirota bacterium]